DRPRRVDGGDPHLPAGRDHRRPRILPATAAPPRGRPRESEGHDMRFSIYTEVQSWPGKSTDRLYGEVLEQIENADRLGYVAYAVIEHFFCPKFAASANPFGLFGMAAARTRRIKFRTMLHVLPYHNPLVLAAMIHQFSLLTGGRYEFGVGRGHGWIPLPAGAPLDKTSRPRYEEALDLFVEALHSDVVSFEREHWNVKDSQVIPLSGHTFRGVL